MSDHSVGKVRHFLQLSEDIGTLYLNQEKSDVTIILDNTRFHGHKYILAARSEYFRALLFGGMKESEEPEIELKGNSPFSFELLLKYIYTGQINLESLEEEVILDVLWLTHKYGFIDLETAICDYLKTIITSQNVCTIYNMAYLFYLSSLSEVCCRFIDKHAVEIMRKESFLRLSAPVLKEIISRNSISALDVDIFQAVCRWIEHNPEIENKEILSAIRLGLMTVLDLVNVVRPTMLFSSDVILDAIQAQETSKNTVLKCRGYLLAEENVATHRHGARVILGEKGEHLLDGDTKNYVLEDEYTLHKIDQDYNHDEDSSDDDCVDGDNENCIVVQLGRSCIINCIKMLLWDLDTRSYSYYIEVSKDKKVWVRVIDYREYLCRSWQTLYFPDRVVKYIRIVGTYNSKNSEFHLVSFECLYTNKVEKTEGHFIVPKQNIATIENSAIVLEGVSHRRNALLNGDTQNYNGESDYTGHQLETGSIVIQLAQPYYVDSMRLLLRDGNCRSYSYKVEISIDKTNWIIIHDRTKEYCQSWQCIYFPSGPVSFIKITGTRNAADEGVFHCVHFECPDQSKDTGKLTSYE
ncbi:BTB/POZ domain-containing protein 9 [Chamberlinius hualienensis]